MPTALDILGVLLILANLRLLGSSRLAACIRAVALQAVILGAAALIANRGELDARVITIAVASTLIKAGALPWLLRRAIRESGAVREVEPFIGFTASLLWGVGLLGACLLIGARLSPHAAQGSGLLLTVALFTTATGLMIIVSRRKAVTQVLGYLAMENGIYAFGMAFAIQEPLLVEMGVLLDVFVAVFVMGIAIYNISREFDHIDTDRLTALKD
jgi:hydrogenase-4 component E